MQFACNYWDMVKNCSEGFTLGIERFIDYISRASIKKVNNISTLQNLDSVLQFFERSRIIKICLYY